MANISMFAIPAYWVLCMLPHTYAIFIMKKVNNGRWNNSNPRSANWDAVLRKSAPAEVYSRYERAEAAHKNGFENFPVFVGAILAGNMAALGVGTLNTFAVAYLCMRVLYTGAYICISTHQFSLLRTAIWLMSALMCMGIFIRSGNDLA